MEAESNLNLLSDQVQRLRNVLAANMKRVREKNLVVQDLYLDQELVVHQVDALDKVIQDSVELYRNSGDLHKPDVPALEILETFIDKYKMAIRDRSKVRNASDDSSISLATMGSAFVLEVVRTLDEIIQSNAHEVQNNTDLDVNNLKLGMSQPEFVKGVVQWFYRVMYAHISLLAQFTELRDDYANASDELRKSKEQVERLAGIEMTATMHMAKLQDSLRELYHVNVDAKEAADVADGEARARLQELQSLQNVHHGCQRQLEERETEILRLDHECKKLIQMHHEAVEEALRTSPRAVAQGDECKQKQSENDKLSAKLSKLQKTYNTFHLARAEEHDMIIAENVQLQNNLQQRTGVGEGLEAKNAELKQAAEKLQEELSNVQTQLSVSEIQCDTFKAALDDVLSRQMAEQDEIRRVVAQESDMLLQNAARKIEELEKRLQAKDEELLKLHDAAVRSEREKEVPRAAISPPASVHKPTSKKRKAAGRDTTTSWSQGDAGYSPNLAAHGSPMPPTRLEDLARVPEVVVDLGSPDALPATFNRQSLSHILGGSVQGLIVRCTNSATDLARSHNIQDYLCPNMDHNPWSPAGPGKHGYMQVGLGRDRKLFNDQGDYRHVFVGAGKFLVYCGWYHVLRVAEVTKEEWQTLPDKVKTTYSETTVSKENAHRSKSAEEVLAMYNGGVIHAPLVRLQCVGFDTAFYQELVHANDRYFSDKPRPGPPANGIKRRRLNGDQARNEANNEDGDRTEVDAPAGPSSGDPSGETPGRSVSAAVQAPGGVRTASTPGTGPTADSSTSSPARLTRSASRRQEELNESGPFVLRIPGGRSTQQSPAASQVEEAEVEAEVDMEITDSSPSPTTTACTRMSKSDVLL